MLVGGLLSQAHSFAGDARLPPSEALALRLSLIRLLRDQGRRLAQVCACAGQSCWVLAPMWSCLRADRLPPSAPTSAGRPA